MRSDASFVGGNGVCQILVGIGSMSCYLLKPNYKLWYKEPFYKDYQLFLNTQMFAYPDYSCSILILIIKVLLHVLIVVCCLYDVCLWQTITTCCISWQQVSTRLERHRRQARPVKRSVPRTTRSWPGSTPTTSASLSSRRRSKSIFSNTDYQNYLVWTISTQTERITYYIH